MAHREFRIDGISSYCKLWLEKEDWLGKFIRIEICVGNIIFTTDGPFQLRNFLPEFIKLVNLHDGNARFDNKPDCSVEFWTKPDSDFIRMKFNISLIDPDFADPLTIKGGLKFEWESSQAFLEAFRFLASQLEEH